MVRVCCSLREEPRGDSLVKMIVEDREVGNMGRQDHGKEGEPEEAVQSTRILHVFVIALGANNSFSPWNIWTIRKQHYQ